MKTLGAEGVSSFMGVEMSDKGVEMSVMGVEMSDKGVEMSVMGVIRIFLFFIKVSTLEPQGIAPFRGVEMSVNRGAIKK